MPPTDASLHEMLSRAVAQSYHLQQEAYLAQARAVLAAADPRSAPMSVGLALPLDAAWYERYKKGEVSWHQLALLLVALLMLCGSMNSLQLTQECRKRGWGWRCRWSMSATRRAR